MTQQQQTQAIEALVDKNGLYAVVSALELMCYEKAEHLLCNWQDAPAARRWNKAGAKCSRLHVELEKIQGIDHGGF